jgi:predicted N-acetyltransferase YhbS
MVLIRTGMMKDCTDLLEVYQGTRWFYRTIQGGYTTVEQVKEEHRGAAFERWGWLVAEERRRVIGEIVFRVEKNPSTGRVGIIRNLDIDVRNQKAKIGTQLTKAAEIAMKKKKVVRVIATTPPAAYNYWMKVNYFARGSIVNLSLPLGKIPEKKRAAVKFVELREQKKMPKSMHFSNIAYPGSLAELAGKVIDGKLPGRLFEFHINDSLGGVGVVAKSDANVADFAADITKTGVEHSDLIISRTARAASTLRVRRVSTSIPKDQLKTFMSLAKWSSEISTDIPVTKLL